MGNVKYIANITIATLVCFAASQISADQITCSGELTTDSSNGLQINCDGSLTIVGGSLTSNSYINMTATDALYLDEISVTAPNINVVSRATEFGSNAKLDTRITINETSLLPVPRVTPPNRIHWMKYNTGGQLVLSGGGNGLTLNNAASGNLNAIGVITNPGLVVSAGVEIAGQCSSTGVPSVFQMVESGNRYCAESKSAFHQVRFLRTTAECHTAPSSFEIAPTQDFPADSSTQSKAVECSNIGTSNSSCVLYEATGGSSNSSQPYTGRLAVKWGRNGEISRLSGRIIEKSPDGCHSESTLKFVKKIRQPS